jgi:hypothetical protein
MATEAGTDEQGQSDVARWPTGVQYFFPEEAYKEDTTTSHKEKLTWDDAIHIQPLAP